jgi:hypothetical protein
MLAAVYPDFFFREVPAKDLDSLVLKTLKDTVCPQAVRGIFSVGVYTIFNEDD